MSIIGNSTWEDAYLMLNATIPVFGFTLGQNTEQLHNRCKNMGYSINSNDCNYLIYAYNTSIAADTRIINKIAANNRAENIVKISKLIVCYENCTAANGNTFVINQYSMIPWFVDTLWEEIGDIQVK